MFRNSLMIGALALAGCGGGTSVGFLQQYANAENKFETIKSTTVTETLPTGDGVVFGGLAGMTFDIGSKESASGGFGLANVVQPGGDYLAVATVEITVDFDNKTFIGRLYNFDADESHTISGEIDITGGIDGSSKLIATLSDDNLFIDGFSATIAGDFTDGYVVGGGGDSLWANHESFFSFDGGSTTGTVSGGLYASQ